MFKPVGDRVVIKRVEAKKMSSGGIIIPDSAQEKMAEGEVVSIGYGKAQDDGSIRPMDVNVGDRVLFSKYAGTDVTVEDQELLILREEDIFGILEKKAEATAHQTEASGKEPDATLHTA